MDDQPKEYLLDNPITGELEKRRACTEPLMDCCVKLLEDHMVMFGKKKNTRHPCTKQLTAPQQMYFEQNLPKTKLTPELKA